MLGSQVVRERFGGVCEGDGEYEWVFEFGYECE